MAEGQGNSGTKRRNERFHGRVGANGRPCAVPGCEEPGEFRAPASHGGGHGEGPGNWHWLCLDHVRAFNSSYNYFEGMTAEEISDAQNPYGGWDRQTRAFASLGEAPQPKWQDFSDPLDAIGARFRERMRDAKARNDGRPLSPQDRSALKVLGLSPDADRKALRQRYADLVRRFHPDRNGGDRSHEKRLQEVISAYTQLRNAPAFA